MDEKQSTPAPINDLLEVADISELFKGSQTVQPLVDDFVSSDPLNELYRQAVEAAKEHGWAVPDRAEFERAYRQEMAGKRHE